MLEILKLNVKNIHGWKSFRKIIVISVDDYGTIRTASKKAKDRMQRSGLKMLSHFDHFDSLENEEDLLSLFEVLSSVKDNYGNHASISAFALSANIDFEKVVNSGYNEYHYELLSDTFKKLKGYENVYNLWKEGIDKKLLIPHFHGREHINLKVFMTLLRERDKQLMINIKNQSYAAIDDSRFSTLAFPAAFDFYELEENETFKEIIIDGLNTFKKVFGFRSDHFNAPGAFEHHVLHETLFENGIKYLDQPFIKNEHQGKGKYKKIINYTGKKTKVGQTILVRNVVFEPTTRKEIDWVAYTLKQIEIAFRYNRPAIISSHRVNFSGHIDPKNRKQGIKALKELLKKIIEKWPDVEFMAANELGYLISKSNN